MNTSAISITIFSDFVCPWCYIGHQRLIKAAEALQCSLELRFRPYLLNPQLPDQGISRQDYVAQKFGAQAETFYAHITEVAAQDGLFLRFDLITHQPNTFALHRLVSAIQQDNHAQAEALVLRLFQAFLCEGKNLNDPSTIAALYAETGGTSDHIDDIIQGNAQHHEVKNALALAQQYGVQGVPLFVLHSADDTAQDTRLIPGAITQQAWEKLLRAS